MLVCPVCGNDMAVLECPKEHGTWFDKNELYTIINELGESKNMKVAEFLKDMFSKEK